MEKLIDENDLLEDADEEDRKELIEQSERQAKKKWRKMK